MSLSLFKDIIIFCRSLGAATNSGHGGQEQWIQVVFPGQRNVAALSVSIKTCVVGSFLFQTCSLPEAQTKTVQVTLLRSYIILGYLKNQLANRENTPKSQFKIKIQPER